MADQGSNLKTNEDVESLISSLIYDNSMKKEIASARAFCGNYIESIILMCDLKPISSWKKWQDNYGNKLTIYKNKSIKITQAKNVDTNNIADIFVKSDYNTIYEHSYWVMQYENNDEKLAWFIGNDGRLRALYNDNTPFHPLLSGIDVLRFISNNFRNDEDTYLNKFEKVYLYPNFAPLNGFIKIIDNGE